MPQIKSFSNSKLIQSIRLLSTEEFKHLSKWLQSPWCNSNKKLYELYVVIKNVYPDFEESALTKKGIFKTLYPDKDFNDRWMRNIFAELNKQVEKFLIHERIEQEQNIRELLLAKTYEERHQSTRLFQLASRFKDRIAEYKNKSLEDYYYNSLLNDLLYYSTLSGNRKASKAQLLRQADLSLDQFYQLGKWRYLAEFKERERLIKENHDDLVDINFLKSIQKNINIPAIKIYEQKLKEKEQPTKSQFKKLKNAYFKNFEQLNSKDQKIIYYYLLNTLIRISFSGKSELYEQLFNFYLEGVERKILIQNGRLSNGSFANIITLGNSLKKFKSVKILIDTYTPYLKKEDQLDAKTWSIAHWHFNKKEYKQIINLLRTHKFKVQLFEIQGRFLLLQTYFENLRQDASYHDLFYTYSQSYQKFIYRNKLLAASRKKGYLNFIKYTCKCADLLALKEKDKTAFSKVIQDIDQESIMQGKRWLTEIINQMIKE